MAVTYVTLYPPGGNSTTVQVVEGSQLHFIYAEMGFSAIPSAPGPPTRPDPFPQYVHDDEIGDLLADAAVPATDPVVAGLVSNSGSATGVALRAAYASNLLGAFDDFSTHANGTLSGATSVGGLSWTATGANLPTVTSGKLGTAGLGYAYLTLPATPRALACGVQFTNPDSNYTMTMAWVTGSSWQLNDIGGHFNFGPLGFSLTFRQGGTFSTLMTGVWRTPLVAGITHLPCVAIAGSRFVVTVNGETFTSRPDPRVLTLPGSIVFWEPGTIGSASAQVVWAAAFSDATSGAPQATSVIPQEPAAGMLRGTSNETVGGKGTVAQVSIGPVAAGSGAYPGIRFGADTITAVLKSAASAATTTIVTDLQMPSGSSLVIDQGLGVAETVTTNGWPTGSGPYTHTLTAGLTNGHSAGAVVVATTPSSGYIAEFYQNTVTGWFYLPDVAVLIVPNGGLYIGSSLGQQFYTPSDGVIGVFGNGAGKGAFLTGSGATTGRPTAAAAGAGAQWYDTTLHKPIWSDGSVWRDAAGTAV